MFKEGTHSDVVQPFIKTWNEIHEPHGKKAKHIIPLSDIYKQECLEYFVK